MLLTRKGRTAQRERHESGSHKEQAAESIVADQWHHVTRTINAVANATAPAGKTSWAAGWKFKNPLRPKITTHAQQQAGTVGRWRAKHFFWERSYRIHVF